MQMGPLETLITGRMFEMLLVTNEHPVAVWMTLPDIKRLVNEWRVLRGQEMPVPQIGVSNFRFGAVPIHIVSPGEDTTVGTVRVGYAGAPLYVTLPPEVE